MKKIFLYAGCIFVVIIILLMPVFVRWLVYKQIREKKSYDELLKYTHDRFCNDEKEGEFPDFDNTEAIDGTRLDDMNDLRYTER